MYLIHLISFLLIFVLIKADDQINYVKQLRKSLLKSSKYNRFARPVHNATTTVNITFTMLVTQILELDLLREILTTDAIVYMSWNDEYIKWNKKKFGNLTKIRFAYDELWKPELEIWNTGVQIFSKDQYAAESEILAFSNGTVYWMTPVTLSSHCGLELKEWPYDRQECKITLGIKEYKVHEAQFLNSTSGTNKTVIGPWSSNIEYQVSKITSEIKVHQFYDELNFSAIEVNLFLKRRLSTYYYFFTLPHTLAILFGIMMFNFQIYSGLRALFAVIAILIDLKIIYIVASQIGLKTFETPVLVKHIGINLILIGFMFIISILIRLNISFLYSNLQMIQSLNDSSFIYSIFLIDSSKEIENDLIKMIKENRNNKLTEMDRTTLNKFSHLIQLIDRILMIVYILILSLIYYSIL